MAGAGSVVEPAVAGGVDPSGSGALSGAAGVEPGDIVRAHVFEADEYDLWAELRRG